MAYRAYMIRHEVPLNAFNNEAEEWYEVLYYEPGNGYDKSAGPDHSYGFYKAPVASYIVNQINAGKIVP